MSYIWRMEGYALFSSRRTREFRVFCTLRVFEQGEGMLRARCRAAQCARDVSRRRFGGSGKAAVRVLADSGQQAPTTGWIERASPSFHSASAAGAAATAGATSPASADGQSAQLGIERPEAPGALESSESSQPESELQPNESHVRCGANVGSVTYICIRACVGVS